ncbi:MAG TPA: TnpV protein [Tissierellaceae bacterium]|nr:TnpV protein [Tissierellaceae bacterium]
MKEITYRRNGDYLIPEIELTGKKESKDQNPLGKYGRMRKQYLQEHRKPLFHSLLLSEKLFPHLLEIDKTANRRMEQIMIDLQKVHPAPDKMTDQMGWVGYMNNLKSQAEEIILKELIYN